MLSMTGFGRGTASAKGLVVQVELSSVNRKQLDILVNSPRQLGALESRIQDEARKFFSRGRVTGEVRVDWDAAHAGDRVQIDESLAASYLRSLKSASEKLGLDVKLDSRDLLKWPQVVRLGSARPDVEQVWPLVRKALREALAALKEMRSLEGARLLKDLEHRLGALEKILARIEKRAPAVQREVKSRLCRKLKEAGLEVALDDERLLRELALYADRGDIAEEITRLHSHADQARKFFQSTKAVGRSLDFLAQEMFREINTIGSKGNDSRLAHHVVDYKAELERMREQIQNVE